MDAEESVDLLDLVLQYECNLKCSYCTITDGMRAREPLSLKTVGGEIARAASLGCTSVQFTGGEPTLWPGLIKAAAFCRAKGYTDIKVQSNGLLFAHEANVERLGSAGVNRVAVSVHGWNPTAPTYVSTTRGPDDAEDRLRDAIANLVASPGLEVEVDLIVMRSTLPTIVAGLAALHQLGVQTFKLWFVSLTDNNAKNVDSMPTLTEVVPAVSACLAYGVEHGIDVRSLHVPRCLLPGHEDQVDHPGVGVAVRVVTPDAVFDLRRSRLSGGHKPDRCATCRYDDVCPGLREDYVGRYGDEELVPVAE